MSAVYLGAYIYLLCVPGWVHVCCVSRCIYIYIYIYIYCLWMGGYMSVVYLGVYICIVWVGACLLCI